MRKLLALSLFTLFVFFVYTLVILARQADGKLKLVFCSVGQGDAIFVRSPQGVDILVDGGPNEKVLSCLAKHMPFWDRTIELMVLTHPHEDHYAGILDVLERFKVEAFATEKLANTTSSFKALQDSLMMQKIPVKYLYDRDIILLKDAITLRTLSPTSTFLGRTSPNGLIGENDEFASLILLVTFGQFSVLLTGDTQHQAFAEAIKDSSINGLDVLQVPHHGSKTGLTDALLAKLQPKLAVISVGKNRYGHPAKETLDLLAEREIPMVRTDTGDIVIKADGKTWSFNNDH